MYDYLIVGAGIFGAICARELTDAGRRVLVIDKRDHIAGNIYTECTEGIQVHKYGAHIFHTNNRKVWDYINRFAEFNRYTNSPIANYKGELYSLPFNMYTFNKMWGVITPDEAEEMISRQRAAYIEGLQNSRDTITDSNSSDTNLKTVGISASVTTPITAFIPQNLEEQAISLVGTDIYEKLIKGYTRKQWGRPCNELPASIIRRLPVRLTYDNNYFNARYQGIPMGGYTGMIERILDGIDIRLNTDYLDPKVRKQLDSEAGTVIYTGPIDALFGYRLGNLEYRSLRFEEELLEIPNFQGNAVVNYTDEETPYTRIIEHKWFEFGKDSEGKDIPVTVITREYSHEWKPGEESYYPIGDEKNLNLYEEYRQMADTLPDLYVGGRLGEYKYYDMDTTIEKALELVDRLIQRRFT